MSFFPGAGSLQLHLIISWISTSETLLPVTLCGSPKDRCLKLLKTKDLLEAFPLWGCSSNLTLEAMFLINFIG